MRIETRIRDRSPDPHVRPRTGTVERRGTAQQRTTDPASASGSAFRSVRYVAAFSFALAHQNKAAGCPDPSPVLGFGPSRTDPSHPGIAFAGRAMPTMKGTVQEDDYRTEVRFKDKNLLKIKIFASSGSQSTWICKLWIRDSDPDLNPDPGLNRWHQSGGGSAACRWIQPGLRYHQSGLGGSTNVGTSPDQLPWPTKIGKEKWPIYYDRKKEPTPKNTSRQRKIGPDCLLLLLLLYTFLLVVKGIKSERKIKEKEKRSPNPGHYWPDPDAGPGSGPLRPGF